MEIDKDQLIEHLGIQKIGARGFYTSDDLLCPSCGRGDSKFGIKFINDGGLVNCWRCAYKGSIFQYLKSLGKDSLIHKGHRHTYEGEIKQIKLLNNDNYEEVVNVLPKLNPIELPRGYKRIYKNSYLQSRGITPKQLEDFGVGYVKSVLYPELRDYLIFQIIQNGELVAWIGRTPFDKDWHDNNYELFRSGKGKLKPRYLNNQGVEFQDILGGLDEISESTKTVIIVEGLFDKLNLDNLLLGMDIVVVFTFGHSISNSQISLLKSKKSVEEVIIMFDSDSLKTMKKTSMDLLEHFDCVLVAPILFDGIDPGNMNVPQLSYTLSILKDPTEYFCSIFKTNIKK